MQRLTLLLTVFLAFPLFADEAKSVADYKAEALAAVEFVSVTDATEMFGGEDVVFVDVREGDELLEHGTMPGATHLPRGVLEFYIDPASGMHMRIFSSGQKLVFFCETGGRSLLAAKLAKDMGVSDAVYLEGGFRAWAKSGAPVDAQ